MVNPRISSRAMIAIEIAQRCSRILAIVHPGMIPGCCALHGMCSTLKDQGNADLPEVFKV
jgi:hypothetical protein